MFNLISFGKRSKEYSMCRVKRKTLGILFFFDKKEIYPNVYTCSQFPACLIENDSLKYNLSPCLS